MVRGYHGASVRAATVYLDDFYVGNLNVEGATRHSDKDTKRLLRLLSPASWGNTAVRVVTARGGMSKRCSEAYTSQMCAHCRHLQKQGSSVSGLGVGMHGCSSQLVCCTSHFTHRTSPSLTHAQLTYKCGNLDCQHVDSRDGASARCLAARARVDQRRAVMGVWVSEARADVDNAHTEVERMGESAAAAHVQAVRACGRAGAMALFAWVEGHTQEAPRVLPPLPWPPQALCGAYSQVEQAERELERCVAAHTGLDEVQACRSAKSARDHAEKALRLAQEVVGKLSGLQGKPGSASATGVTDRSADASGAASSRW